MSRHTLTPARLVSDLRSRATRLRLLHAEDGTTLFEEEPPPRSPVEPRPPAAAPTPALVQATYLLDSAETRYVPDVPRIGDPVQRAGRLWLVSGVVRDYNGGYVVDCERRPPISRRSRRSPARERLAP
jgi:hypothetical protein